MRLFFASVTLVATTLAFGQSPFVGMWQTRTSRVTDKPAIAVVIVELEKRLGGAVVLANSDASEMKLPILNLKIAGDAIEFETQGNGVCFWSLKLQKNRNRGLLHGGCPPEMLIDEQVRKRHQSRK
jgi:hypothetical protein